MFKLQQKQTNQEDSRVRETCNAQSSIFEFYSEHELGQQLKQQSDLLDEYPQVLTWVAQDFCGASALTLALHCFNIEWRFS